MGIVCGIASSRAWWCTPVIQAPGAKGRRITSEASLKNASRTKRYAKDSCFPCYFQNCELLCNSLIKGKPYMSSAWRDMLHCLLDCYRILLKKN